MVCLTGRHVLQEDRSYLRVCLTGGYILEEYMFYRMAYLTNSSRRRIGLTGEFLIRGHVLQEYMCYKRKCIIKRHDLKYMSYWKICPA